MSETKELTDLIDKAKNCKNKGRMYVYDEFKQELKQLDLQPHEYEYGCRMIAKYLKV